jgi:hypothetical protein
MERSASALEHRPGIGMCPDKQIALVFHQLLQSGSTYRCHRRNIIPTATDVSHSSKSLLFRDRDLAAYIKCAKLPCCPARTLCSAQSIRRYVCRFPDRSVFPFLRLLF